MLPWFFVQTSADCLACLEGAISAFYISVDICVLSLIRIISIDIYDHVYGIATDLCGFYRHLWHCHLVLFMFESFSLQEFGQLWVGVAVLVQAIKFSPSIKGGRLEETQMV